jgi:hypothetical protein
VAASEPLRPRPVPLEAGIAAENPPCPACGEPLFGWASAPVEPPVPVRRCESCGLGAVGEPGEAEDALAALERLRVSDEGDPRYRIANRRSLQASIGGDGWAWLEPGMRYLFTREAVLRLVASRDQQVERCRWLPGAGLLGMWGTLVNGFTLGRNIALGALGRAAPTTAAKRWQRVLDRFISAVVALPVMIVAVPLEAGAAVAGRGGALELTVRPL